MADINTLAALWASGSQAMKNKIAELLKPGDVMSPQERAAYQQAAGEPVFVDQQAQPAAYEPAYEPPRKTIDREAERRYLEMRRNERERMGM